jgi:hypothetical protein
MDCNAPLTGEEIIQSLGDRHGFQLSRISVNPSMDGYGIREILIVLQTGNPQTFRVQTQDLDANAVFGVPISQTRPRAELVDYVDQLLEDGYQLFLPDLQQVYQNRRHCLALDPRYAQREVGYHLLDKLEPLINLTQHSPKYDYVLANRVQDLARHLNRQRAYFRMVQSAHPLNPLERIDVDRRIISYLERALEDL